MNLADQMRAWREQGEALKEQARARRVSLLAELAEIDATLGGDNGASEPPPAPRTERQPRVERGDHGVAKPTGATKLGRPGRPRQFYQDIVDARAGGESGQGIANRLNITPKTVYGHFYRAKQLGITARQAGGKSTTTTPANDSDEEPEPAPVQSDRAPLAVVPPNDAQDAVIDSFKVTGVERARAKLRVINGRQRSATIAPRRLTRDEKKLGELLTAPAHIERPITRGDCGQCPTCQEWRDAKKTDRHNGGTIRETDGHSSTRDGLVGEVRLRDGARSEKREAEIGPGDFVRLPEAAPRPIGIPGIHDLGNDDPTLLESTKPLLPGLRREGDTGVPTVAELSELHFGHGTEDLSRTLDRTGRQQRELRAWKLQMGDSSGAGQESTVSSRTDRQRTNADDKGMGTGDRDSSKRDRWPTEAGMDRLACGHRISEAIARSRPCVFVACRLNLFLDVNEDTGAIKLNFPQLDPDQMTVSCVDDVAQRGGVTLEEVGAIVNLTRERVRQIEVRGLDKMKDEAADDLLDGESPERFASPLGNVIS